MGHNHIGTEHILLGLLRFETGFGNGMGVLTDAGLDQAATRVSITEALAPREQEWPPRHEPRQ